MSLKVMFATLAVAIPLAFGAGQAKASDIVETAQSAGQFSTLVAALDAAGLVETLKSEGPFTVFAPTDEAFSKLPDGTVENLLKPENKDRLISILTYHVIPGKTMSSDLAGKTITATTVQGQDIQIDATGGNVNVNEAKVIAADVTASNGVIHVIDQVIIPQ